MYWTLELATKLEDAPWPATKEELIDYAKRSGAPLEVIENLEEIEDEGDTYMTISSSTRRSIRKILLISNTHEDIGTTKRSDVLFL